jgi:hypothetical protein
VFSVKILKNGFRRFVHFPVLFIEKYGENRVANQNIKNHFNILKVYPIFLYQREKTRKLATL